MKARKHVARVLLAIFAATCALPPSAYADSSGRNFHARQGKKTHFRAPEAKVRAPFTTQADYQRRYPSGKAASPELSETEEVVLTPAIRALATDLGKNPVRIASWVRNEVKFAPTFGSIQGADMALATRQANAFDTASLTIALLRASDIPARYAYGTIELPVAVAQNWVGGVATPEAALALLGQGGIPSAPVISGGRVASIQLEHVWVEAQVDLSPSRGAVNRKATTWVPIDPSFKQYAYGAALDVEGGVPFNGSALVDQLKTGNASVTADSVTRLNAPALPASFTAYRTQAQAFIARQKPSATVGDVLGTKGIVREDSPLLAGTLPYRVVAQLDRYAAVPDAMRWRFAYGVYADDVARAQARPIARLERSFAAIGTAKIAVTFAPAAPTDQQSLTAAINAGSLGTTLSVAGINVKPQLWLDAQLIGEGASVPMGTAVAGAIDLFDPRDGLWSSETSHTIVAGETHAIAVAPQGVTVAQLAASRDRLSALQSKLAANQFTGLDANAVTAELLHNAALSYLSVYEGDSRLVRRALHVVGYALPSLARASTTADVSVVGGIPLSLRFSAISLTGEVVNATAVSPDNRAVRTAEYLRVVGQRTSAFAHLLLDRLFADAAHPGEAASAVRALARANDAGQTLRVIGGTNVAIADQLDAATVTKDTIKDAVKAGLTALTSQGEVTIGTWQGSGYVLEDPATGGGDYDVTGGATGLFAPAAGWNAVALAGSAASPGSGALVASTTNAILARMIDYSPAAVVLFADYDSAPWSSFVGADAVISAIWSVRLQETFVPGLSAGVMSVATALGTSLTAQLAGAPAENHAPVFTTAPITIGAVNQAYRYFASAVDADGDPITYTLAAAPSGMTISANGLVSWTPAAQGAFTVVVRASDGRASTDQSFVLTIGAEIPLDVALSVTPQFVGAGSAVTITVATVGGHGTLQRSLKVDGVAVTLDANGQASVAAASAGVHTVEATASDDRTTLTRASFYAVRNPADTTPPTAAITTPVTDSELSAPVDIVGTASDANFAQYALLLAPAGTGRYTTIATGNAPVTNGVLGRFDPSTLANGLWDVMLRVVDVNGAETTAQVTYEVFGNLKVGAFRISFVDLSIEAAGLPLQVTRTYDSTRKTESLDFGYGWSVDYQSVKLQKNVTLGLGWEVTKAIGSFEVCLRPKSKRLVTVSLPDGKVERFSAHNRTECINFQPPPADPVFDPVGRTTSTLEVVGPQNIIVQGGNLIDGDTLDTWNPTQFKLTTVEGFQYFLKEGFGIQRAVTPDGNSVDYGPTGIVHSNGQSLFFDRDAKNRIVAVTDRAGLKVAYTYGPAGDFATVSDRNGAQSTAKHDAGHQLLSYIDARGVELIRNEYDAQGRLVAQYDAQGNKVDLSARDPSTNKEVVKNRRGATTTYVYDGEGNVTSQTDALGGMTSYSYDARANESKVVDPTGRFTERTFGPIDQVITEKDAAGNTTIYGYVSNTRDVNSIQDARGNVTTIEYSGHTPSAIHDGEGAQTLIGTQNGNLTALVDATGNRTIYTYTNDHRTKEEVQEQVGFNYVTRSTTTYEYDANGNQTKETQTRTVNGVAQTLVTTRTFDAEGNVLTETDPTGAITKTTYNAFKKVASTTDALGRVTQYDYEPRGYDTKVTHADGLFETKTFDAEGNEATTTDRAGRTTTNTYDLLNRLTRVTYSDGRFIENGYDGAGRLTSAKDERGNTTTHEYDLAGRRSKTTASDGGITLYEYDPVGNLTKATDARGGITSYEYDKVNRRTKTTFPLVAPDTIARFETYEYDVLGRRKATVDSAGRRTEFGYDAQGRLTSVTQSSPDGTTAKPVTAYGYDEVGNKLTQTDALNRITKWEYDAAGRVTKRTLPGGQAESFEYDAAGNVTAHVTFRGERIAFMYDELNRVKSKTVPVAFLTGGSSTTTTSYTYTATGQLETVTDARGLTRYEYDARDRVTKVTLPEGWMLAYTYDEAGNRATLTTQYKTDPARTTVYTYDVANRLKTLTDGDTQVWSFDYDKAGNRIGTTNPNGTKVVYSYDERNRLTKIEHRKTVTNALIESYEATWNDAGLRSQVTTVRGASTCTFAYAYDALNRLTSATQPAATGCAALSFGYGFDAVGNRTSETGTATGVPTTFTVDANDRLSMVSLGSKASTYEYDAAGNVTKQSFGTTAATFTYDAEDRLVSATTPAGKTFTYLYDHEGQLIAKREGDGSDATKTTNYLVDKNLPFSQILEERDGNGKLKARYEYAGTQPLKEAVLVTSGTTETTKTAYYHADHLSVRLLTDGAGATLNTYAYSPYGEVQSQTGTFANAILFASERFDSDLGLYYLRARLYDPRTGRFASVDLSEGKEREPLTLHDYLYANADPLNRFDPRGRMSMGEVGAALSSFATLSLSAYSIYSGGQSISQGDYLTGTVDIGAGLLGAGFVSMVPKAYAAAYAARVKYLAFLEQTIPAKVLEMKAAGASLESIARTVNYMRNSIKIEARQLQSVNALGKTAVWWAEKSNIKAYGNAIGPTLEELIKKKLLRNPKLTKEEILEDIIEGASRSRDWVNKVFGLGGAL